MQIESHDGVDFAERLSISFIELMLGLNFKDVCNGAYKLSSSFLSGHGKPVSTLITR